MTLHEALAFLANREIARSNKRQISMVSKIVQFPVLREPTALASTRGRRWIAHGGEVLFLSPSGTGIRPYVTVTPGRVAIRRTYSVQFVTAATLVDILAKVDGDSSPEKPLIILARQRLRIINELDYPPFKVNAVHHFFLPVLRRHGQGLNLITSNRSVGSAADRGYSGPVERLVHDGATGRHPPGPCSIG